MSKLCERVLERIKNEQMEPIPRWRFVLSQVLVAVCIAGLILFGALVVGQIMEFLDQLEVGRLWSLSGGVKIVFSSIPYILIVIIILIIALLMAEFFRTRHGYKYKLCPAIAMFLFLMLVLGMGLYAGGISAEIEQYFIRKSKIYSKIIITPEQVWSQPEKGLLSGVVLSDDEKRRSLSIADWKGNKWKVDYGKAVIGYGEVKKEGEPVRLLGKKGEKNNFQAEEILPWGLEKKKRANNKSK